MRRTHTDAAYHDARPLDAGVRDLPMFAEPERRERPAWAETWAIMSPNLRKRLRASWEAKLEPIALELAERRGGEGITASELISEGITRGVLWGERSFLSVPANRNIYAFAGSFLRRLANEGKLAPLTLALANGGRIAVERKADRALSHRNKGAVYVRAA